MQGKDLEIKMKKFIAGQKVKFTNILNKNRKDPTIQVVEAKIQKAYPNSYDILITANNGKTFMKRNVQEHQLTAI